jgi:hypothetical protein
LPQPVSITFLARRNQRHQNVLVGNITRSGQRAARE